MFIFSIDMLTSRRSNGWLPLPHSSKSPVSPLPLVATRQVSPSISSTTSAPIKRWSVPCHPLDLKMGYPNHWLIHHFPIEVAMAIDGTSVDPISRQTLPKSAANSWYLKKISYKSKTSCIICQNSKTWMLSSAEFAPFFKPAKKSEQTNKAKEMHSQMLEAHENYPLVN